MLSRMRIRSNGPAAEIEKMRRYLELPVHGGKENSSPPSLPPKKQLSIANFARSLTPGAHEEKERISYIHTVVISKNKVTLADSHSC